MIVRCLKVAFLLLLSGAPANGYFTVAEKRHADLSPNSLRRRLPAQDQESLWEMRRKTFYTSQLFHDVQTLPLFADSKTFPDMTLIGGKSLEDVVKGYEDKKKEDDPDFTITGYVKENFKLPEEGSRDEHGEPGESMMDYIDRLWPALKRNFSKVSKDSSMIPLPKPALIPGGRFRESYYWDALFPFKLFLTEGAEKYDWAIDMLDNFKAQIDRFGYIPNGNRDYYLDRSQPPVFGTMIEALMKVNSTKALEYIQPLETELNWWSRVRQPDDHSSVGRSIVIQSPNGDNFTITTYGAGQHPTGPRPEAFLEDLKSYEVSPLPSKDRLYEDIHAAAESGWDFSSRFTLGSCEPTSCLATTEYAPVDLNALIGHNWWVLGKLYELKGGHEAEAEKFINLAQERTIAVNKYFWDAEKGNYADYLWRRNKVESMIFTPASVVPLLYGMADEGRAQSTLDRVEKELVADCGVRTSTHVSRQQWDRPYGWAPLQYWTAEAAWLYGRKDLTKKVCTGWKRVASAEYEKTRQLFEKYDVEKCTKPGDVGEYVTQSGFAFTNAVLRLMDSYSW